jgi:hypothetical protein
MFAGFGHAVAIRGDTALIGADHDNQVPTYGGAAYVFTRSGTNWVEEEKLIPDDLESGDFFGSAVALGEDIAIIGARNGGSSPTTGAAYSFIRGGDEWTQAQRLAPSDLTNLADFGASAAMYDDIVVVGAPLFVGPDGQFQGAAYVFEIVPGLPFSDGFESGDLSGWSSTVP